MRIAPLALLILAFAGCRTAKGVYTDALAYETAGSYDDAARAYVDALRRDPNLPNAAGRLAVAGNRAVGQHLVSARSTDARRDAADHWLAAEALAGQAQAVGVRLDLPGGFAAAVADACAEAVDEALGAGRDRTASGDFANALAMYDGARRFRPSPARQTDLDAGARDAYAGWATADLASGQFRAALAHAEGALALSPPGSAEAAAFQTLAADILDAGTVRVAVFPITEARTPRGDAPPPGLLRDATDVLLDDRLAPPFVALADPAEARRAVRDSRADLAGNARVLADLTRRLGAAAGLVAEVDGVVYSEAETARRDVTFRLRAGGTAPGQRVTTEWTARLRYALVGVFSDGRRLDCGPEQTAAVSVRYDTATTAADVQTLRLSDDERDQLSDRSRDHSFDTLTDRLRDALATELASRITACTAPLVP